MSIDVDSYFSRRDFHLVMFILILHDTVGSCSSGDSRLFRNDDRALADIGFTATPFRENIDGRASHFPDLIINYSRIIYALGAGAQYWRLFQLMPTVIFASNLKMPFFVEDYCEFSR